LRSRHSSFFHAQQEDVFALEAVELGNLFKVKLRHDNSNFSPSWFVDRVEIRDLETDKLYPFVCERWLSKKKEEGKIQRTLYVKGFEVYLLHEPRLSVEKFSLSVESNSHFLWYCVSTISDWLEKLAPLSQTIRSKPNTNCPLLHQFSLVSRQWHAWLLWVCFYSTHLKKKQ